MYMCITSCLWCDIHVYICVTLTLRSIVLPGTLYCIKYLLGVGLYKCETTYATSGLALYLVYVPIGHGLCITYMYICTSTSDKN